jgi:hypothetical protein
MIAFFCCGMQSFLPAGAGARAKKCNHNPEGTRAPLIKIELTAGGWIY